MTEAVNLIGSKVGSIRIVELLAQGGMGAVYVGNDEKLNRRVAVKAVHERFRVDSRARADFLQEARVLSRLQHPNICQIFDLIEAEEGDYLVLELIFGRTLAQALEQGVEPREKPEIAVQMAEALVAAHGKGVVHWDVKPANVMLTEDRQVKVLDFGVARSMDDEAPTRVLIDSGPRSHLGDVKELASREGGEVVGTLGYMSPEQARGDRATPASDMYSFGLVLQELFTGRPAFEQGLSSKVLFEKTTEGESIPMTGVDPDLARLVERMKSPTPGPRPSAVDTLERLQWIFAKPARRARQLLLLGAAVALVAVAIGTSALWIRGEREAERARLARDQADELVGFMLSDVHSGLEPLGRLDLLDRVAQRALDYYEADPEQSLAGERAHEHRIALRHVADVLKFQGRLTESLSALRASLELGERLDPADPRWRHEQAETLRRIGEVLSQQGQTEEAMESFRRGLEIEQTLVEEEPFQPEWQSGLAAVHSQIGGVMAQQGRLEEARESYEESLALKDRLVLLDPANDSWRYSLATDYRSIGDVLIQSGHFEPAMEAYEEALQIWSTLTEEDPANAWWLNNLAIVHGSIGDARFFRGQLDPAEQAYGESLSIRRRLVVQDPSNAWWRAELSLDSGRMGDVLARQGRLDEAMDVYQESLAIRLRLVAQDPTNVGWQSNLAIDYRSIGDLLVRQGRPERALEMFEKALEIDRSLAEQAPENDWWQNSLAYDHVVIGKARRALGEVDEAREAWDRAASIMKPVTDRSSNIGFVDTHVVALLLLDRVEEATPLVQRLLANHWQEPEFLELAGRAGLLRDEPTG